MIFILNYKSIRAFYSVRAGSDACLLKFPTGQKQSLAMSCACLASLAESYIIEVVFWLFLSKTGYAFQTTAFTELVTGLPLVLRARESSFSTERGTCARLSEHTV